MPTLLKLDSKIINLDQVFEINDYGDRIRVFYAVPSCDTAGTQQPTYAELDGDAAEALRRWLLRHSTDLMTDLARELGRPVEVPRLEAPAPAKASHDTARRASRRKTAESTETPADGDQPFYGADRIRQMQGAGDAPPRARSRRKPEPAEEPS
ncbi:MAG TPA: hypothetical protein VFS21_25985 [Roseiflexaceae bacterium]|nr:hypothetical protein [Roseiflexaceae bacterium]